MSTFTQVLLLWIVGLQLAGCTTLRHQLGRVLVGDETEYALESPTGGAYRLDVE